MVWPTRLIYLVMREVLCDGFNLAVLYIPMIEGDKTHICIVAIKDKRWVFSYLLDLSLYIMSSCVRRYSVFVNLIH